MPGNHYEPIVALAKHLKMQEFRTELYELQQQASKGGTLTEFTHNLEATLEKARELNERRDAFLSAPLDNLPDILTDKSSNEDKTKQFPGIIAKIKDHPAFNKELSHLLGLLEDDQSREQVLCSLRQLKTSMPLNTSMLLLIKNKGAGLTQAIVSSFSNKQNFFKMLFREPTKKQEHLPNFDQIIGNLEELEKTMLAEAILEQKDNTFPSKHLMTHWLSAKEGNTPPSHDELNQVTKVINLFKETQQLPALARLFRTMLILSKEHQSPHLEVLDLKNLGIALEELFSCSESDQQTCAAVFKAIYKRDKPTELSYYNLRSVRNKFNLEENHTYPAIYSNLLRNYAKKRVLEAPTEETRNSETLAEEITETSPEQIREEQIHKEIVKNNFEQLMKMEKAYQLSEKFLGFYNFIALTKVEKSADTASSAALFTIRSSEAKKLLADIKVLLTKNKNQQFVSTDELDELAYKHPNSNNTIAKSLEEYINTSRLRARYRERHAPPPSYTARPNTGNHSPPQCATS